MAGSEKGRGKVRTSLRKRLTPGPSSSQPIGIAHCAMVRAVSACLRKGSLSSACRGPRDESDMDPALEELTV